jgi:hypothetical protein
LIRSKITRKSSAKLVFSGACIVLNSEYNNRRKCQ